MITPADRVLALALAFHRDVEGEYGCPGVTCPGVQRLVAHFTAAIGVGVRSDLPGAKEPGRLFVLTYSIDYEDEGIVSIHASYAGALSAAGRAMTRPCRYSDPYGDVGISTTTDYQRMPIDRAEGAPLDRWRHMQASTNYEITTEELQP